MFFGKKEKVWSEARRIIGSTLEGCYPPTLNSVFYESSYACPKCGHAMYKTVFPIGGEYKITMSNGKTGYMKRVFTCPDCHYFVTAALDRLSDGKVIEFSCADSSEYNELLDDMDIHGTTQGRRDGGGIIIK